MKDLTKGNEAKLIVMFALPMLLGNLFQQFYNMVDSWVVGRFVGTEALAAVGTGFPIIFLMVSLVMGFGMGANVLIAQYFGAKDTAKVRAVVETTYLVLFWSSLFMTIVGIVAVEPILRAMRLPEDLIPSASSYLRIIFGGMVLTFGYNGVSAILRGLGDSVTPLFMLIAATLLNVALDLLFVVVFGWGIEGVAWATVIAQGVSLVGSLVYLDRTHEILRVNYLKLRFDRDAFSRSLKIGLPSGIQQTLVSLGFIVMNSVVNGFGTTVIAGYAAASRIDTFVGMPSMNISMALSAFVGQNLGAGKPDRARRGFRAALVAAFAVTAVLVVLLLAAGRPLVGIFTEDAEVVAVGARYLAVIAPFYFVFTLMFITNGLVRGAGEAVVPMLSTLVAMWLVRVPAAMLFSSWWGIEGVWWSFPTGWFVGAAIAVAYYKSGAWTRKALVRPAPEAA